MKKETIIAIILGIAAGIGIAIFVISNSQKNRNADDVILDQTTPAVAIDTHTTDPLLIDEPETGFVTDTDSITIKGSAQKDALIIVQSNNSEQVLKNKDSAFSAEIDLTPGENSIKITAYTNKNIDTRSLLIYYVETE